MPGDDREDEQADEHGGRRRERHDRDAARGELGGEPIEHDQHAGGDIDDGLNAAEHDHHGDLPRTFPWGVGVELATRHVAQVEGTRTMPSCITLATRAPSRRKIRPDDEPAPADRVRRLLHVEQPLVDPRRSGATTSRGRGSPP